jgi:integrase/recombinase XerD
MTQSTQPISLLRQRMIEDMQLRKFAPRTQTSYIRAVKKLDDYLGHSPDLILVPPCQCLATWADI